MREVAHELLSTWHTGNTQSVVVIVNSFKHFCEGYSLLTLYLSLIHFKNTLL